MNSGGSWWLEDSDWYALEAARWKIDWYKDEEIGFKLLNSDGRWFGALAGSASINVGSPEEAMRKFEAATNCGLSEEGCNCCGAPHTFEWKNNKGETHWVSGKDFSTYVY